MFQNHLNKNKTHAWLEMSHALHSAKYRWQVTASSQWPLPIVWQFKTNISIICLPSSIHDRLIPHGRNLPKKQNPMLWYNSHTTLDSSRYLICACTTRHTAPFVAFAARSNTVRKSSAIDWTSCIVICFQHWKSLHRRYLSTKRYCSSKLKYFK
jgi:hypothetical protein